VLSNRSVFLPPTQAEPPPPPVLAAMFRRKVERLEEALKADPGITSAAALIVRNLIDAIILHPREGKGRMLIEVYGEPSVLFLSAADELADEKNWMITVVAEERYRLSPQPENLRYRLRLYA
jgi:hypothetical protein